VHAFDAKNGNKLSSSKTGGDTIFDMNTGSGTYPVVIANKRGLTFFTFDDRILVNKRGMFNG
jgi:hypothetical protein